MIKTITKIAGPAVVSMFLQLFAEVINTIFVGHLGDSTQLAAVGLGNMAICIVGLAVFWGLNGTVETFVS